MSESGPAGWMKKFSARGAGGQRNCLINRGTMTIELAPPHPSLDENAAFELLFYGNPLPMWVFDNDTLQLLAVNEAAVAKYGWSQEEFLAMTIEDIRPPEDLPELRAYRETVRHDASPGLNATRSWRHRTKSGEIIHVESTWMEIPFGGKPGVLVMSTDRSALVQAEERARGQAAMLDLATDAIMVRDLEHELVFWSRGAERIYGWTEKEAVGSTACGLLRADVKQFDAAFYATLEKGEWSGEMKEMRKDGSEVFVSSRWTLVREGEHKPVGILVINTDVTETRQLEMQFLRAQRLEAIGTLASGIAHDLNNILSPILMAVGMLRRDATDPMTQRMLNIIETSAERGAGVVKQVLTFARGVDGERALLQPKHLLSELGKIMAQTFPREIDIQTQFSPDLWMVMGDATQLHQVLLNLCVNARDAIQSARPPADGSERKRVLTVSAENAEIDEHFASMNPGAQLGAHVVLQVTDTGGGMSPETMDKIFNPFFTTKAPGKGTGLGLATCIGIIKSHGGFLTVQSELGVGTTFRAFVPASPDGEGAAKARAEPAPVVGGNGELVLVVDDEAAIREALVRTLETNGYRCFTAEDGTDALALYFQRRAEIAIIITDLAMAQMDGVKLVKSLRRLDVAVPVIVSSGHLQKENQEILEKLGVSAFLDKPYTADNLLRALHGALHPVPEAVAK